MCLTGQITPPIRIVTFPADLIFITFFPADLIFVTFYCRFYSRIYLSGKL